MTPCTRRDTLARVAAFIDEKEPSDLVYGDSIMASTGARHAGEFDLDRLLFETNICHQSIFYRRELFCRYRTVQPALPGLGGLGFQHPLLLQPGADNPIHGHRDFSV